VLAVLLIACFLASIARFYHPGTGFTALIGFADEHAGDYEVAALRDTPHFHARRTGGYDGQFYAQLALVPLLRDPAIDHALDNPQYRARRILFSWTAYLLGLGRPAWILQAYALQNVACWLLLAWLLLRWTPPGSPRGLALWAACLFNHGALGSVRNALLDLPSLLLLACAAALMEKGKFWPAAGVLGMSGLGRETNLLGVAMFRRPGSLGAWAKTAGGLALAAAPLVIWQDYLWSIYRSAAFANQNQLAAPFAGYLDKWGESLAGAMRQGVGSPDMLSLLVMAGLTAQALFVLTRHDRTAPWWRLAFAYLVLMIFLHQVVWDGHPGAVTRVVLPLTAGFNILLARYTGGGFWWWYALGNLELLYAPATLRG
jgi:hypothetical protein